MIQTILVILIVSAAAAFLVWRAWKTLKATGKSNCGCGDCAATALLKKKPERRKDWV
ncbi:MAG: FeoB-associated Cys-rich membrane protein [Sumerlaeia bacterium]